MKITKENRIIVYKNQSGGKLDIYMNAGGKQYKTTVWPNVEDDMTVRSWGGNLYVNEEAEGDES